MAEVRVQKALADAGVASRRASDTLVEQGRVRVNGALAVAGQRVDPATDRIEVDGRTLAPASARLHLAMAKPAGVTSTVRDRHAATTVVELVPAALRGSAGRIYPVGRLDRDSEGLLLLTNDGDWAQRVLHPRHAVDREYAIGLAAELSQRQGDALLAGITLEEGRARLLDLRRQSAAETRALEVAMGAGPRLVWFRAVLRQGWRRQLRRMFAAVGAPVERLVRVRIGSVRLEGMRVGEVRALTDRERDALDPGIVRAPGREGAGAGLIVSLDGPGSSGKSSVGAAAAARLRYRFCDTGLLYRALTWLALEQRADLDDGPALAALERHIRLTESAGGRLDRVMVDGADVTDRVHTATVDASVSRVAKHPRVRTSLLDRQRALARAGRIIMAGRDIGTVVLPAADVKLYLDVSVEERARRRAMERGVDLEASEGQWILGELRRRDGIDSTRATAPLRVPEGALLIGGDDHTFEETVEAVVQTIRGREGDAPR